MYEGFLLPLLNWNTYMIISQLQGSGKTNGKTITKGFWNCFEPLLRPYPMP